jgi:hypothetical protein
LFASRRTAAVSLRSGKKRGNYFFRRAVICGFVFIISTLDRIIRSPLGRVSGKYQGNNREKTAAFACCPILPFSALRTAASPRGEFGPPRSPRAETVTPISATLAFLPLPLAGEADRAQRGQVRAPASVMRGVATTAAYPHPAASRQPSTASGRGEAWASHQHAHTKAPCDLILSPIWRSVNANLLRNSAGARTP